jgi:hypothetical protein
MAKVRGLGIIFNSSSETDQGRLSETSEQLPESGVSTFVGCPRCL